MIKSRPNLPDPSVRLSGGLRGLHPVWVVLLVYLVCVHICVITGYFWGVQEIKLMPSGLTAGTFTCGGISLVLFFFLEGILYQ